eukprot:CCRYP_010221-RA/>CCRYP_010221-RA protein AED:0.10 eAED:0.10 QI:74/1/1/1/0/0/2/60/216
MTHEILILYGSQTGNSESAAHEISSLLPSKLPPLLNDANCDVKSTVMTLDDFLEMHHAPWTPIVIIVCSSYGVGHAPLGARRFREVCDAMLERHGYDDRSSTRFLEGVQYFLLGLGDSHYTTFFRNPTVMDEALSACGALRRGALGKADASGTGEEEQAKVIERWIDAMWGDLAKVVNELTTQSEGQQRLQRAQEETWKLCLELFPDWRPARYGNT